MKIVVIGGSGLIGSKLVTELDEHGHEAVAASPDSGVNTLTGDGLEEALDGAAVVADVSNSPSFEDAAVLEFFETSTSNLLAAEAAAGVGHHVALSVVGTERPSDYDIEGTHFAERCQLFIIIALGESIVVTGATASAAGLTSTVVLCLVVAFVETAALWWVYFGATAEQARITLSTCDDPGRLARDAYTYLHLPIVAGIIATAVGNDLLIAEPHHALHGVGLAMMLGGPALFLLGESLFVWRMIRTTNVTRVALAGVLILLVPIGGHVSALLVSLIVATLLSALAAWELRLRGREPRFRRGPAAGGHRRSPRSSSPEPRHTMSPTDQEAPDVA
jgi:hypothetical protein